MRKLKKQLVDAHQGHWFIDTENRDNVRAIDFGRVADITDKEMILDEIWKYKRSRQSAFHMKTSQGTFLSKITSKAVLEPYYDRFIEILSSSLPFWIGNEASSRTSRIDRFVDTRGVTTESKSRLMVHRNIHFCLVFACLIDNAITSNSYPDWDQAQMIWAYESIWGLGIIPDKNRKYPLHHIHELDFEYDTFISKLESRHVKHVEQSYDEIARLISLYIATPDGSAVSRPSVDVPGITTRHMGEFVSFLSVAPCPPGSSGDRCSMKGVGQGGRRYNKSKTRRGRRYNKSTRRGRHHHRRTY
jgi:hypothetical protein